MITDTIDGVLIDSDEAGFELILSGGRNEYRFRIQGVAVELLRAVDREIRPWHAEGEAVYREMTVGVFACQDPESEWAESMRDAADIARKREKGE